MTTKLANGPRSSDRNDAVARAQILLLALLSAIFGSINIALCFLPCLYGYKAASDASNQIPRFEMNSSIAARNAGFIGGISEGSPEESNVLSGCSSRFSG